MGSSIFTGSGIEIYSNFGIRDQKIESKNGISFKKNIPCYYPVISFPQRLAIDAAIWVVQKERIGETGDWNNPCGWSVTSTFDIRYILADILRCSHNEVKISQR